MLVLIGFPIDISTVFIPLVGSKAVASLLVCAEMNKIFSYKIK